MSLQVIYKYPFQINDNIEIAMPVGAVLLLVESQNGIPTIWAKVNPRQVQTMRRFRIIGTGHPFDDDQLSHVATFQQPPFVWHLFELVGSTSTGEQSYPSPADELEKLNGEKDHE